MKPVNNFVLRYRFFFFCKMFNQDKDDSIFKRNFATATLDDHFDKTILPKVMQVGRAFLLKENQLKVLETFC